MLGAKKRGVFYAVFDKVPFSVYISTRSCYHMKVDMGKHRAEGWKWSTTARVG